MSECTAQVFIEGAGITPGLYRHVTTGAVIEVCAKEKSAANAGAEPGIVRGRAITNAASSLVSLMGPLDAAGQMLVSTLFRRYDDI